MLNRIYFQGKRKYVMILKIQIDEFSNSFNLGFLSRESENIKMMKNWTCAFYNLINQVVRVGMKMYYKEFQRINVNI